MPFAEFLLGIIMVINYICYGMYHIPLKNLLA